MRRDFESNLARRISGSKKPSKAWAIFALCAAVLVCGAVAVTAAVAGNGDMVQDQQKDSVCGNDDCPGICDRDCDGICDNDADGDGICDNKEDGTCQD